MYYYIYKEGVGTLAEMEVYFEYINRVKPELCWSFTTNTVGAYKITKLMGNRDIEFLDEFVEMKNAFYEWVPAEIRDRRLDRNFNETDWKTFYKYEKHIYDYWVPKLREFCRKWGLGLNQD